MLICYAGLRRHARRLIGRLSAGVRRLARPDEDATIFSPAITLASMAWRAVAGIDGDDNLTRQSHDSRVMISSRPLAGEGAVAAVPPPDAGDAARRTRRRPSAVLRRLRPPRQQGRVQGLSRAAASDQVVRL